MSDTSREQFEKLFITTDMYVRFFDGKYIPRAINSNMSDSWKDSNQLNIAWSAWQASAEASQARIAELENELIEEHKINIMTQELLNSSEADNAKLREAVYLAHNHLLLYPEYGISHNIRIACEDTLSSTPTTSLDNHDAKVFGKAIDECIEAIQPFKSTCEDCSILCDECHGRDFSITRATEAIRHLKHSKD